MEARGGRALWIASIHTPYVHPHATSAHIYSIQESPDDYSYIFGFTLEVLSCGFAGRGVGGEEGMKRGRITAKQIMTPSSLRYGRYGGAVVVSRDIDNIYTMQL